MTSYLLSNHDRVRKKCICFSFHNISDTFLIRIWELRKLYKKWSISCWYWDIFIDTLNFEQLVRNRVVSFVCRQSTHFREFLVTHWAAMRFFTSVDSFSWVLNFPDTLHCLPQWVLTILNSLMFLHNTCVRAFIFTLEAAEWFFTSMITLWAAEWLLLNELFQVLYSA